MKVALTTGQGRMAPCFAGADLRLVEEGKGYREADVVATHGWHPLAWGHELMRRDVDMLLCDGIDQSVWGAVQGHGIQVIPTVSGDAEQIFEQWSQGKLITPPLWPIYGVGEGKFRRHGRWRCRRGQR